MWPRSGMVGTDWHVTFKLTNDQWINDYQKFNFAPVSCFHFCCCRFLELSFTLRHPCLYNSLYFAPPMKLSSVSQPSSGGDGGGYWLLGLDRQLAGAGAALAGCLVISKPWGGKAEDDNAPW